MSTYCLWLARVTKGACRARRQRLHWGGVSTGIDFALSIIAELAGPEVAQAIQLGIEYDPSPPFDAGHPDKASEAATTLMVHRNEEAHAGIKRGSRSFRISKV